MIQSYQKNQIQIIELDRPKVNAINQELLQSLKNSTPSCKDVNFKFLGISLAGINLILSLFIVIYSLKTLVYEKN